MEVHRRIAAIVVVRSAGRTGRRLEALVAGPRLGLRPIDRAALLREQQTRVGLARITRPDGRRHVAGQQAVAVLGEHRRMRDRGVEAEADKPAVKSCGSMSWRSPRTVYSTAWWDSTPRMADLRWERCATLGIPMAGHKPSLVTPFQQPARRQAKGRTFSADERDEILTEMRVSGRKVSEHFPAIRSKR
ncbi:MAG: hypothetical protein IT359_17470 [Gemmatimonadaceae bacterium]|nr:hypothetical protein [Gemmatimonadaceae bacterium]